MKSSYIIIILVIVLVAKAIRVETPEGKRFDFTQLPRIGSELVRIVESITQRIFSVTEKVGLKTPPSMSNWFQESRAKREEIESRRNKDGWSAVRVTDPVLIQQCVEIWGPHPEGPRKLGDWRSALGCSVEEVNEWRTLSPDLERLVAWKIAGMSPTDTAGWLSSRSITPEEARRWRDAGFSSEIATTWRNLGYSPEEARTHSYGATLSVPDARALDQQCEVCGLSPRDIDIKTWVEVGLEGSELVQVPLWTSLGFQPIEAKTWNLPPATSAEWRNLGFTASEAQQWLSSRPSLEASTALQWKAAGFDAPNFSNWKTSELEHAISWRGAGFSSESEASRWVGIGFTLSEAREWKSSGVDSAHLARTWKQRGFSPAESSRWIRNAIPIERAEIWTSFGHSEPHLVAVVDRMVNKPDELKILLQSGKTLSEIETELDSTHGDIGLSND